ncbi:hypothetical protein E1176_07305 [Fulvivirga sp. RKSG066]|uniref:sensor histidine kinase n=1 Tax=Fulvivirga aurantia TaxID=2529383 RepID=UPI0012BBD5CF|nr:HAMP domain-containing sensor histidine kinase [Fulvivirga aurantia]MTI20822.1 hypothetical protein [Fulvivirga aurantia]
MKYAFKLILVCFFVAFAIASYAQDTRLVQVKLLDKSMRPVTEMQFSFDEVKRYTSNDKGVVMVKVEESQLPPKNVYVYNESLEAESWNYSKGVLEIIIRQRTSKTVRGVVRNQLNEPIPNLPVTLGKVNQRKTTTDIYGEFEFTVPLDFNEKVVSAYNFPGYEIKKFTDGKDLLRFSVSKDVEEEEPVQPIASKQSEPTIIETIKLDSTTNINEFYNYLKGISLADLNLEQREELDQVFFQLISFYEDSLKNNIYNQFIDISETSKIEDDLDYLIERAQLEQNIASEFNRIFSEKIGIINRKLKEDGDDLTAEERRELVGDIELLDQILRKNESLFQENQGEYRQILKSISANLLQITDLENQLSISEQQRIEQQQSYEQRVFFYTIGFGALVLFLAVLAYFTARIKKQKDKTQKAYKELNDLNEHLEELVAERTALLEMTNAELDTFFYKSAHNLRRPLLTIVGLAEVAKLTLDTEGKKLFDKARDTASSMDTMLKKLVMVSHINYPSDKDKVDFEGIVTEIEKDFKKSASFNGVTFHKNIDAKNFVSYPMLMDIVLRNLLENSFEFSTLSAKNPKVTLDISETTEGLKMVVSDNGLGIHGGEEKNVWQMFYVAHENSSGNGLGLYIARKAVKTLHGSIKYNRTSDNITQFIVTVPHTVRVTV